eukprot:COSAG05_NODE_11113_length_530_cov_0.837587_1_plen_78_part_01
MQASQPQGGQSQGSPLFSCDIIYPRVVSDALSTIQLKRGQVCTAPCNRRWTVFEDHLPLHRRPPCAPLRTRLEFNFPL